MLIKNLPTLRTMSVEQLTRNRDRCNRILWTLAEQYPNTCTACRMFRETKMRRSLYISELDRRAEWEDFYAAMLHEGILNQQQYDASLATICAA